MFSTMQNLIIYISKEGYVASGEIVGHNPHKRGGNHFSMRPYWRLYKWLKRRLAEPETVPNETNTDTDDELTAAIDSLSILTVNDLKTQLGELRLSKKGAKRH